MHRVNQRYLMCSEAGLNASNDVYLLVYNPSLVGSNVTSIQFSTSKVEISVWASDTATFEIAHAEAFCYPNLDNQTHGSECEVHIDQDIESLSLGILRIRMSPSKDISIKPSRNLTIYNERLSVTIEERSIGTSALYLTYQSGDLFHMVTFDFRYYENFCCKRND